MTFNRYYVSYPLCCPSRVSAADRPLRPQHTASRATSSPTAATSASPSAPPTTHNLATWLQGAGYRTIHIGKFLNGYGDEPYRQRHRPCRPAGDAWHTVLNADTHHYFYGYTLNNNGADRTDPTATRAAGKRANTATRDDIGCPFAPTQRAALPLRDRHLQLRWRQELPATLARTALLPAARLHRAARRLPPPGRARAGAAPLRLVQGGAAARTTAPQGFDEGNVSDKPALHPRSATPDPRTTSAPTASTTTRRWSRCARSTTGCKEVVDTLGAAAPPAQHLRHLHLRQRLLLRRAPPDRRQVPRLRARHPPALPDPRARGSSPAPRPASWRRTSTSRRPILELAGVEADKSIDGRSLVPFLRDPELRTPPADPLRVLRRRPATSKRNGGDLQHRRRRRRAPAATAAPARAEGSGAAQAGGATPRSLAPPKNYDGNPPRPLQVHRLARRREGALRHQQGPVRAQQHRPGSRTTTRSATSSTGSCATPRELRRAGPASEVTPPNSR